MSGRPAGTVTERLLARIDRTGDCWLWTGAPSGGYGAISISGRRWAAHHAVYNHFVDAIPDRHDIAHTCGTRMCVRPDHLRAVPQGTRVQVQPTADKPGRMSSRLALAASAGSGRAEHDSRVDWRHRAACRGEDPELFFPIGTSPEAKVQTALAKKVCRACPVAGACGSWAMEHSYDSGVWGGTTEAERVAAKRRASRRSKRSA
ncbi:WhiB family transcriptional regulator [Embleya sp. NPDC056575]|uniref:WhiB family transcriptional regulator n=1 Tax=unclassified Embleya TaxID=2699296 RepID=UPI0036A1932A